MANFKKDLAWSLSQTNHPMWGEIYKNAFPSMTEMLDTTKDMRLQKAGIDRIIVLQNTKRILMEEKSRRKDYGDIFLEYVSCDKTNAPGWVCDPSMLADYIVYAVQASGKCYLMPVPQLQTAWRINGGRWRDDNRPRQVKNDGYNSWGVGVKAADVLGAIQDSFTVRFTPEGDEAKTRVASLPETKPSPRLMVVDPPASVVRDRQGNIIGYQPSMLP